MPLRIDNVASRQPDGIPAAHLMPFATTLLAALLSLQPVHLPGYVNLTPAFALMTVYYWTIFRPDLLPPLALFGIGVVYDLLSGGLPGVTPFLFLLSRVAVLRCRRWFINRTFSFLWGGFTLLTSAAMAGLWMLHSVLAFQFIGFTGSVFRTALTISLFPILSYLLGRIQFAPIGTG